MGTKEEVDPNTFRKTKAKFVQSHSSMVLTALTQQAMAQEAIPKEQSELMINRRAWLEARWYASIRGAAIEGLKTIPEEGDTNTGSQEAGE